MGDAPAKQSANSAVAIAALIIGILKIILCLRIVSRRAEVVCCSSGLGTGSGFKVQFAAVAHRASGI
jgi:hypothetical protein